MSIETIKCVYLVSILKNYYRTQQNFYFVAFVLFVGQVPYFYLTGGFMYYPISYKRIRVGLYSVYLSGSFIGEVCLNNAGWFFRTFDPVDSFHSSIPSPTRYLAICQWPGLSRSTN